MAAAAQLVIHVSDVCNCMSKDVERVQLPHKPTDTVSDFHVLLDRAIMVQEQNKHSATEVVGTDSANSKVNDTTAW